MSVHVNKIEKYPSLHSGEQKRLQRAIGERIYQLANTQEQRQELFRRAYSTLKLRYNVSAYKEIKQQQLQDALRFISDWDGRP